MIKSSYMGVPYEYGRSGYIIYARDKYGKPLQVEFRVIHGNEVLKIDYFKAKHLMKKKALRKIKKLLYEKKLYGLGGR